MADAKISADLSKAIQDAVRKEVARLESDSLVADIRAAEAGVRLDAAGARRYVIYWTARQALG